MVSFITPSWVKEHNIQYESLDHVPSGTIEQIRDALKKFNVENPEVSIVVPAYNEEKDILKALSSLSRIKTKYRTELIVSNNNSKDRTQEILDRLEVKSVFAANQGISYARQAGLEAAKGKYILNADSDSIYPETWVEPYIDVLKDPSVSCAYGTYSFIPGENNNRLCLAAYETIARTMFMLKRKNRECVNVMGFNFAYRKDDAMQIGGFDHNLQRKITGRSEDGWMALCLMKLGKIQLLETPKVTVWTSDRRLMEDGGLGQAFTRRVKKEISRIGIYFKPSPANQ
ncbi:MAG: glycosyltransferase [Cytophagaceae bacterium]|nr:glycosyltransferase [Cytophagaceae bacterium]